MTITIKNAAKLDNYELLHAVTRSIKSAVVGCEKRSKNAEFQEEYKKVYGNDAVVLFVRYYGDWAVPDEYKHLHEDQRVYYSLDDDTSAFIQKVVNEHALKYPELTIFWSVGEREWLNIHVEAPCDRQPATNSKRSGKGKT